MDAHGPCAAADRLTQEVNRLLHKTFITPIDREQIHGLINAMDDVLDLLQDATETMSLYDVRELTTEVVRLGELSVRCCERVAHVVTLMPKLGQAEVAEAVGTIDGQVGIEQRTGGRLHEAFDRDARQR